MELFKILSIYNLLDQIPFKGNNIFLSNDLKRKIVSNKIKYNKYKKEFESNVEEFKKNYLTEEIMEKLKTDESLINQINIEINKYSQELLQEKKEVSEITFNEDEYNNIIDVMYEDVQINGVTIPVQQFLEIIYETFCNKESDE